MVHNIDLRKFRFRHNHKKKLLKEIEKENKVRQELENRKLARASREERKRLKMELKEFKQKEKMEKAEIRKARIARVKGIFSRKKKSKPVIDSSGVA